jgi:hypothetical protein
MRRASSCPLVLGVPSSPRRLSPAGYVPNGDKYAGHETLKLLVRSEMVCVRERFVSSGGRSEIQLLHALRANISEVAETNASGKTQHHDEEYGGPFYIQVSPKMKVEDVRLLIRVRPG